MALLHWNESMSVGVEAMDREHQRLMDIINRLNDAMLNRRSAEELNKIFISLRRYAQTHFASEERYMESIGYPGLEDQRSEHCALVRQVAQLEAEHQSGKLLMGLKTMEFLKDWLLNHIQHSDKKYGAFATEKV